MAKVKVPHFSCGSPVVDHYLQQIDTAAEALRHVTPAQEAIYQRKLAEARAGGGELLAAEAQALGVEVLVVIERVLAARDRWERHAHRIEVTRVKAKAAVRAAGTPSEMHAAFCAAFD